MIIKVKGVEIEIFESAEKMTMKRYQRFNKFLMIDNEVGSSFEAFNLRLSGVVDYLKNGLRKEAVAELENWRQCVYNAFTDYTPKGFAFALIVCKIDGEAYNDITATGLEKVLNKLEELGVTQEQIEEAVAEVKKKIETELKAYFPNQFQNVKKAEFNQILKELMLAECDLILEEEVAEGELEALQKRLLESNTPNVWNVYKEGNMEREMEVEFTKFILAVGEHTAEKVDEITVFRFYTLIEFIKEKNNDKKAQNGDN